MIEMEPVGNSIEILLFDVFTDNYYLNTFQLTQENKEVLHEDNH